MKQKYFPDFKNSSEFHKILLKNDLMLKITSPSSAQTISPNSESMDDDFTTIDYDINQSTSLDLSPSDDSKHVRISAVITSTGRCNDLKTTYAIYILDITKLNESNNKADYWQTYRRFNDFHDFHLIIKKNVCLNIFIFEKGPL